MAAHWPGMRLQAQREWGHLPDAPFDELERRRAVFVVLLQSAYGMTREEAERELDRWSGRAR